MRRFLSLDMHRLDDIDRNHISAGLFKERHDEILKVLRNLGAVRYDLILPETRILPLIIHPNEHIRGIVYGRYKQDDPTGTIIGRGALVATSQRVFLIDHKPLFIKCDEISYEVVSAVSYTKVGFAGTVTLHTRLGNINIRTFNKACAHYFVEAIEESVLRNNGSSLWNANTAAGRAI